MSERLMPMAWNYSIFKSCFNRVRGFFTLLPRILHAYALTYALVMLVWIVTHSCDWSICSRVFLLLCKGVNGLRVGITEARNCG